MALQVVQATNIRNVRRRPRRPQHKFNLISKPYQIVPFMLAPVLPGETLQNLLMQSRVVSDPVVNRLVGWHKEYYFFYVPHLAFKDEEAVTALKQMMLDPTTDTSGLEVGGNDEAFYAFGGGFRYLQLCYDAVVQEFFRDEDETPDESTLGDYYTAQIDQQQWWNSLKLESEGEADLKLPGQDELDQMGILPGFETAYAQWELMRDAGLVDVDYDDFIRSYGVDIPKAEEVDNREATSFRPELVRFSRSWSYPSNTIDPTDGSATSALSWSIAERADKKRFFKFPGFIFGVTVTRPKIYLGNQKGAAVGFLTDALSWLPSVLQGHAYASIKEIEDSPSTGPFQNATEDYWFDVKDLFLYGDQFVNYAMDQANTNSVALPDEYLNLKYPSEADVNALFKGDDKSIREDGICHLNILGRQRETTP